MLGMVLPIFTTPRLRLTPATMTDHLDALHEHWAHPEVRRFLFDDVPVTRERAAEALGHALSMEKEGYGLWPIQLNDSPALAGCAGLVRTSTALQYDRSLEGAVEAIVSLVPSLWGRGFASEALGALIDYGFRRKGLAYIQP